MQYLTKSLILLACGLSLCASQAFAGSDEYLGDASIYAGVPTTSSRPNVLIIIDNSRATLHEAAGREYFPWVLDENDNPTTEANIYPQKWGCTTDVNGDPVSSTVYPPTDGSGITWSENPQNGCYLPWNVYTQDNQGDFARLLFTNSDETMASLCDPRSETEYTCEDGETTNPLLDIFQAYGSYSGSGVCPYPNLTSSGACDWRSNSSSGEVYALGNYLNYVGSAEGDDRVGAPDPGDGTDPCPDLEPPDTVKVTYEEDYCTQPNKTLAECNANKIATRTRVGYFECRETHFSSADSHPINGPFGSIYWSQIAEPADTTGINEWSEAGVEYLHPICEAEGGDTTIVSGTTQREIIYNALSQVIAATAGVVNFGAMSYGDNNSGGKLLYHMDDLSRDVPETDITGSEEAGYVFAPDCTTNSSLPFCQFLNVIPGPGETDGEPVLSSNTLRPQAESLLDAGYYYDASYTAINFDSEYERIPAGMENICGRNHIILLTNGFSNGDGSPKLDFIGDADGDEYGNESVYGLGSHWLDDVAKHLKNNYGVTTHTVLAFQAEDALVKNAAKDGGGQFYNVFNAQELSAALLKLLSNIINEANTSFVAPVVPASTTNRTISSNKVYLGLFRPQQEGPWHGNVKKYGLSLDSYQLTGYDGSDATDPDGNFDPDSISYWSRLGNGKSPSVIHEDDDPSDPDYGYVNPNNEATNPNLDTGDGGQVDVGGAGGVLLEKVRTLTAAIRANGWEQSAVEWRKIYTYLTPGNSDVSSTSADLTATQNRFEPTNANITVDTLALPASATQSFDRQNLMLFMHGFEAYEGPTVTTSDAQARKWVLGDILHSRPLVFNYTKYPESVENRCSDNPDANGSYNTSVVYAGANDGMLHAFRDCDGEEIWAFIPPNALSTLQYYMNPQEGHPTFVDSAPSLLVYDKNEDGTIDQNVDKVVLVFGQRRGGGTNILNETGSRGAYYALDVTNPTQPVFLWETDNDQLSEFGETWSQPRLAKVHVEDDAGNVLPNAFKLVAFVGIGYDNNEDLRYGGTQTFYNSAGLDINQASTGGTVDGLDSDGNMYPVTSPGTLTATERFAPRGRGLAAIEIASYVRGVDLQYTPTLSGGGIFWDYTAGTGNYNGDEPEYSFASDLTVLDFDGDTFADAIYTGDTGGNLWRFKINNSDPDNWTGTILFQANPGADELGNLDTNDVGRKIFYRPAVAYVGAPHIYFGTGDREHPLNISTTDRMYCVIDWGDQGSYPVQEDDLVDVTTNQLQDDLDMTTTQAQVILDELYSTPASNPGDFTYGWFVKLDGVDRDAEGDPGEKMLAPPTVFNGEVYFSTYQLIIGPKSGCQGGNLGISRLYHMDYKTGEAVMNYDSTNDLTDGSGWPDGTNERALGGEAGELLQRTDRVRTLGEGIPSGIVTIIDASGRVTQLISSSDKVEAGGVADIKLISPVYWMQW